MRSQIYLLIKEVLSEEENDHMGQYRLGVLKKFHSLYPDDEHLKKELGIETTSNFSEYSNDALNDMIINLSRFEGNEEEIQMVKAELARRKA